MHVLISARDRRKCCNTEEDGLALQQGVIWMSSVEALLLTPRINPALGHEQLETAV